LIQKAESALKKAHSGISLETIFFRVFQRFPSGYRSPGPFLNALCIPV
jgi:hypothetical protein